MLKARCRMLPCKNAYVTSCHGSNDTPPCMLDVANGHNANQATEVCGARFCSRKTATLATISAVVAGGIESFRKGKRAAKGALRCEMGASGRRRNPLE